MNDTAPNVIVIPAKVETPQEQEKRRHLRVAAYCRVSRTARSSSPAIKISSPTTPRRS